MASNYDTFVRTLVREAGKKGVAPNNPVCIHDTIGLCADEDTGVANASVVDVIVKYEDVSPVLGTDFTKPGTAWLKLKTDGTAPELWQYIAKSDGSGSWVRRFETNNVYSHLSQGVYLVL